MILQVWGSVMSWYVQQRERLDGQIQMYSNPTSDALLPDQDPRFRWDNLARVLPATSTLPPYFRCIHLQCCSAFSAFLAFGTNVYKHHHSSWRWGLTTGEGSGSEGVFPPAAVLCRHVPTLVLDLDDVLVHSDWTRGRGWRTFKRPGVDDFLKRMAPYYEMVVYTSQVATPLSSKLPSHALLLLPSYIIPG